MGVLAIMLCFCRDAMLLQVCYVITRMFCSYNDVILLQRCKILTAMICSYLVLVLTSYLFLPLTCFYLLLAVTLYLLFTHWSYGLIYVLAKCMFLMWVCYVFKIVRGCILDASCLKERGNEMFKVMIIV